MQIMKKLLARLVDFLYKCLFKVLSVGPIPDHIAFIMDGNRRFAKKINAPEAVGHRAGHSSLVSLLSLCYEMHVTYVTVYAFSIENFKRKPQEIQNLMELIHEKTLEVLEPGSIVSKYDTRIYFIGNLTLLDEPVRLAAEEAMRVTAGNTKTALLICMAYTSGDEVAHAVGEACIEKVRLGFGSDGGKNGVSEEIKVVDIERHMYMAVAPDPDIMIRSSGETRLSNFLLWQTAHCPFYSPAALWPELGLRHLVWAILDFQRSYKYLEKKKRKY